METSNLILSSQSKKRSNRFKNKNKNKYKKKKKEEKDEETVGEIVEPAPTTPTVDAKDSVEHIFESNDEPSDNDLESSSQRGVSSDEDDINTIIQCVCHDKLWI